MKTSEGEHTRGRLLSEARDLYLEAGLGGFSLREVARRSGVSAPAVYRHFDSQEALLREVCGQGFRIFSSYLLRALEASTASERMAAAAEMYLRFAMAHPRDYRFIFMSAAEDAARLTPPRTTIGGHDSTFQFLIDRVGECMREKVLRKGDPEDTAMQIWAYVHGLVSLRLTGHFSAVGSEAKFARFYQDACQRFLAGLGP